MKIALIHPAGSNWLKGKEDVTVAVNRMPPLGILSIAALLRKEGACPRVYDFLGEGTEVNHLQKIDEILQWGPDLIGFTCTTSSFPDAYAKTKYIKSKDNSIKVVFGGPHVSSMGKSTIERFPLIDYAVVGEGEVPLLKLLQGIEPSNIAGLVYRNEGNPQYTGVQTDLLKMDDLPLPAYDLLQGFPEKYNLPLFNSPSRLGATIISSRGCPYRCSYCDRSVFGKSYRYNSAEYLFNHMTILHKKYGITHFNIYDDLFTLHKKRVTEVCNMLADSPHKFTFNCAARIGHLDNTLLQSLKKGGCWMISLGIESGVQELLNQHKSNVDLGEVKATVAMIQSAGVRAKGLFIMGLPGETPKTAKTTKDYILSLNLDDMNYAKFTPFPGSPAYRSIHLHGKFTEDWSKMNCLNFVFLPKAFDSFREMDKLYSDVIQSFYQSKAWRRKLIPLLLRYPHNIIAILKNLRKLLGARKYFTPQYYSK